MSCSWAGDCVGLDASKMALLFFREVLCVWRGIYCSFQVEVVLDLFEGQEGIGLPLLAERLACPVYQLSGMQVGSFAAEHVGMCWSRNNP